MIKENYQEQEREREKAHIPSSVWLFKDIDMRQVLFVLITTRKMLHHCFM